MTSIFILINRYIIEIVEIKIILLSELFFLIILEVNLPNINNIIYPE